MSPLWRHQVIADLEEEKRRHAEDTAEGDDVTYILEKQRERLQQQVMDPSPWKQIVPPACRAAKDPQCIIDAATCL